MPFGSSIIIHYNYFWTINVGRPKTKIVAARVAKIKYILNVPPDIIVIICISNWIKKLNCYPQTIPSFSSAWQKYVYPFGELTLRLRQFGGI